MKLHNNQSGFGLVLVIIVAAIAIGGVGYFAYQNYQVQKPAKDLEEVEVQKAENKKDWKTEFTTFEAEDGSYSFQYPTDWKRVEPRLSQHIIELVTDDYQVETFGGMKYVVNGGKIIFQISSETRCSNDQAYIREKATIKKLDNYTFTACKAGHNSPYLDYEVKKLNRFYIFSYVQPEQDTNIFETSTPKNRYLADFIRIVESLEFNQ